jgi:hypothetical protein
MMKNKRISEKNRKFLQDSQCGTDENNRPKVCCPLQSINPTTTEATTTRIEPSSDVRFETPCLTPSTCKVLRTCPVLFKLMQTKPISEENKTLLRESQCGKDENDRQKVCCPSPEITTMKAQILTDEDGLLNLNYL